MTVKEKRKQKSAQTETRHALMMRAKDKGIKNFRVLNKEELGLVLAESVTSEQIQKVVSGAVTRWKSGWTRERIRPRQEHKILIFNRTSASFKKTGGDFLFPKVACRGIIHKYGDTIIILKQ